MQWINLLALNKGETQHYEPLGEVRKLLLPAGSTNRIYAIADNIRLFSIRCDDETWRKADTILQHLDSFSFSLILS